MLLRLLAKRSFGVSTGARTGRRLRAAPAPGKCADGRKFAGQTERRTRGPTCAGDNAAPERAAQVGGASRRRSVGPARVSASAPLGRLETLAGRLKGASERASERKVSECAEPSGRFGAAVG